MLEQRGFDLVQNELRAEFDVIIIDSPPIGLFPDSLAIARKVDEVLFVTRFGKVSRKIAKSLIDDLEATGVDVLGVVLNDLPHKKDLVIITLVTMDMDTLDINTTISIMVKKSL